MVFSKAAGSSATGVPEGTLQDAERPRTQLEAMFRIRLFYRHALCEVARLIHIFPAQHCNVIRQ